MKIFSTNSPIIVRICPAIEVLKLEYFPHISSAIYIGAISKFFWKNIVKVL